MAPQWRLSNGTMRLRTPILLLPWMYLAVCGCSSDDKPNPATADSGADVGSDASDGATDAATEATPDGGEPFTCGDPPLVTESGNLVVLAADGTTSPKGGVKISVSPCPDKSIVTPPDGKYAMRVSSGKPLYFKYESSEIIPMIRGEYSLIADSPGGAPNMYPTSFAALFGSDFGPDKTLVFIYGRTIGTKPECKSLDGITISVKDHPEAKVTYFDESAPPKPIAGGTATSRAVLTAVTGLADGLTVTMQGTKTGCTVLFDKPPRTGRAPLFKGFLTSVSVTLAD